MATTTVSYNGDGAQNDFTITFAYTAQSFIQVFVDAVLKTAGVDYDFNSTTVIRFKVGKIPPAGTNNVELRRVTGTDPLVDWEDGASILESDQDLADLQILHIVEELENNEVSGMGKSGANWDAESVRITNVSAPLANTDAATKASIAAQVTAAELAETNAETAETNAETAETNAQTAETGAETAETNAAASAAAVAAVFPTSGLTTGRTLVATAAAVWSEKVTRTWEIVDSKTAASNSSIVLVLGTVHSRFLLELLNYRPITDNTDLLMTISDDSESSYETAGYDRRIIEFKGSLSNNSAENQSSFKFNKQGIGNLGTDRENQSFEIHIFPGNGTEPFTYFGSGIGRASDNNVVLNSFGGVMMSSVTATRITHLKFVSSSGNLGTGTFNLWGLR